MVAAVSAATTAGEHLVLEGYRRLAGLLGDLLGELSVDAMLRRIAVTLRELVPCDDLVLWECVDGELVAVLVDGADEEAIRALRIRLGEGITGRAALDRRPIVSNQAHLDPRAGLVPGTELQPEAIVALPLAVRGVIVGALTLYRQGEGQSFAPYELELAAHFAEVAAIALNNVKTRAQLALLAATDDLTGVWNRRRFREELARELARARRSGDPLSLLLFDLDGFKQVNDRLGHDAGDAVLAAVAGALTGCARTSDGVARIGGDEFAVLLPSTAARQARRLARRLTDAIAAADECRGVSASVGVATSTGGAEADLLAEADRLLYVAKSARARETGAAPPERARR